MTTSAAKKEVDSLAVERWIGEGGHEAPEEIVRRERSVEGRSPRRGGRSRVLIAGAGVAGLETLLALRALAGTRVDITLLAPEPKFVNRSMAVDQPFKPRRVRGIRLEDIADELGARWHRGTLDRVEHERRRGVTRDGEELGYDVLVLAPGARIGRILRSRSVFTFRDNRDGSRYRMLLGELDQRQVEELAFVRPAGATWPFPLYDLALLTAEHCARHRLDVALRLVTPEESPLSIFGAEASAAVRYELEDRGVTVHTNSYGVPSRDGGLQIWPGAGRFDVDRIVTLPRVVGPRLRGIHCDREGFIHTDAHGRLADLDGVFAAGDATTFPIKQGGLAAQQADAVAEAIAASVGADVDPQPFRPVLRGVLLAGGRARYLRADISGGARTDSIASREPLWWPPNKLCGRYLAPFLSSRVGEAADVMPQHEHAIRVETPLDELARGYAELADLRSPMSSLDARSSP